MHSGAITKRWVLQSWILRIHNSIFTKIFYCSKIAHGLIEFEAQIRTS